MKRLACMLLLSVLGAAPAAAQPLPVVDVGRIERLPAVPSKHVDPRHVDVDATCPRRRLILKRSEIAHIAPKADAAGDEHETAGARIPPGFVRCGLEKISAIW